LLKSLFMKSKKPEIRDIIVLGYGGNCRDIREMIQDINKSDSFVKYNFRGFLDDNRTLPVLGPLRDWSQYNSCYFVNGIGSTTTFRKKEEIINQLQIPKARYATLVHPSAYLSKTARIGAGGVIFQNVVITSNVKIGRHVMILPNSVISHDTIVGDYSILAGCVCVSGAVVIGKSCYVGSNTSVKDGVTIGEKSLIGCGTNVVKDITPHTINIGNPSYEMEK